jgi:probable HAF family extracellular repeat protein
MQPLGTLGGANSRAFGINAAGQIVGESETSSGEVRATLWTIAFATEVVVDIKPGSDPNSVNPRGLGVIPVAILSDGDLDATTVDPLSVAFGPNGASEIHGRGHREDVDGDGRMDLVLHFGTRDTGIQCDDTEVVLTGATFDGGALQGTDAISTVGCR